MKKPASPRLLSYAFSLIVLVSSAHAQSQQLITNGNFAAQPVGTSAQIGPNTGDVINSTTYSNFRFYNVATNTGLSFGSQIIGKASVGSTAMRLDVNNPGAASFGQYGLDIDNNHVPVTFGTAYTFSFDAAYIGGGNELTVTFAEYDASNTFNSQQTTQVFTLPTGDMNYHPYTFAFTPLSTSAKSINILFAPGSGQAGTAAVSIDNVRFGLAVPKSGTGTPGVKK